MFYLVTHNNNLLRSGLSARALQQIFTTAMTSLLSPSSGFTHSIVCLTTDPNRVLQ